MTSTRPDRRTKRTQQSLHVALNRLILEKGYEATTIKDITHRANVGRSTFYAHHGSKEGLLLSGLQHLRTALTAAQRDSLGVSDGAQRRALGFSRAFFEHVHEYRDIFQTLVAGDGGPVVTAALKRIVTDLVRSELGPIKGGGRDHQIPSDAVIQFTVDALFSILFWWFERSPKLPPVEVDAIFRRLAIPALAAAGFGKV